MDPTSLVSQVAAFDTATIQQLLDQSHRDAHNAKLHLTSLREHLVTARVSPQRVSEELAEIASRKAREIAGHNRTMKHLENLERVWSQSPEEAKAEIEIAKIKAADAARIFNAVNMVAAAKSIASSFPAGTDFSEVLAVEKASSGGTL